MGWEDPVIKQQENAYAEKDSPGLSVKRRAPGVDARPDAPARMEASVGGRGSANAPLDGREQSALNTVLWEDMDQTVQSCVFATTAASATVQPDNASVLKGSRETDVMRSAVWAPMVRTVKVCVTVRMVLAATILTEAAFVNRASAVHTAETACVRMEYMACTVNAHASVRTNTH